MGSSDQWDLSYQITKRFQVFEIEWTNPHESQNGIWDERKTIKIILWMDLKDRRNSPVFRHPIFEFVLNRRENPFRKIVQKTEQIRRFKEFHKL